MIDEDMHDLNDIDYEDMDGLPLLDHIEWNHYTEEPEDLEDFNRSDWIED